MRRFLVAILVAISVAIEAKKRNIVKVKRNNI